jgi:internalin A
MATKKRFLGKTKVTEQPAPTEKPEVSSAAEDSLLRNILLKEDWPLEKIAEVTNKTVLELLDSEKLTLRNTGIKSIRNIGTLKKLKMLDLAHTFVTDLSPLKDLKELIWLNLWHTEVAQLAPLKEAKKLEALNITDTKVKDIDILKQLPQLKVLQLSFVDKSVLNVLKQLTNLDRLYLFGVWLPEADLQELKKCLPGCKIVNL